MHTMTGARVRATVRRARPQAAHTTHSIARLTTALVLLAAATSQGLHLTAAAQSARPEQRVSQGAQGGAAPAAVGANATANPQQALLDEVAGRLFSVAGRHPGAAKYVWPPPATVENRKEINAFADIKRYPNFDPITDRKTGKFSPGVVVTPPFMSEIIQGERDRLAFVIGHEIAHILLGHVLDTSAANRARREGNARMGVVFTADQEHDADVLGMKLALSANYSIRGARGVWNRINGEEFRQRHPGWDYTSFEGVGVDHPAWSDRLALIDKERESLWKSMSAFENGVYFLTFQKYPEAEEAFRRVVSSEGCPQNCKGFPDSYDGWANLGYARLMQYLDQFEREDIARYKLGQLVTGSFYVRPESFAPKTKGVDDRLWREAVAALKKALELNPQAALARANLGVAYLVAPTGKNAAEAVLHLEQAAAAVSSDRGLTNKNHASVLINSAVALAAGGETERAAARLRQAGDALGGEGAPPALKYNRALLLLSRSGDAKARAEAVGLLVEYLNAESTSSLWWAQAYDLYARLSSEDGQKPVAADAFMKESAAKQTLRPVVSVDFGRGLRVTLSDPVADVQKKLGAVDPFGAVEGTTLVRLFYPEHGLELLATRRVLAIFLRGDKAPALSVRMRGAGAAGSYLKVGMNEKVVKNLFGSLPPWSDLALSDLSVRYRFYKEVGVGVRYNTSGNVEEIVVTHVPVKGPAADEVSAAQESALLAVGALR